MEDYFGKVLNAGDIIIYVTSGSGYLSTGVIVGFGQKKGYSGTKVDWAPKVRAVTETKNGYDIGNTGLLAPYRGKIKVDDKDVKNKPWLIAAAKEIRKRYIEN